jgi:short-subunit dehydrogenase
MALRRRKPGNGIGAGTIVVVTGASSGIGRATARAFARRGATVVLAARSEEDLRAVVLECQQAGGRALAVPTDLADDAQARALVATTLEYYHRIDVWVGCASVFGYGRFLDVPDEEFRRTLQVNLFAQVESMRMVVPDMLRRGSGTVIFVGSLFSKISLPYLTPYVTGKHALFGFAETLRLELRGTGVDVCSVLPATIDTPIYQHAANRTGRAVKPMPPVVPVHRVAAAIVGLALRPRPVITVGRIQNGAIIARRVAPRLYDAVARTVVDRLALDTRPAPPTAGNLFVAKPGTNRMSGGWRRRITGLARRVPRKPASDAPSAPAPGVGRRLIRTYTHRHTQRPNPAQE